MSMYTHIWQHNQSGELYAVTVNNNVVMEAAGPLRGSEIISALCDGFDGIPELTEDINQHKDNYRLVQDHEIAYYSENY